MSDKRTGHWPQDQDRTDVAAAADCLREIAYRDCYDAPATKENCDCEICVVKRALAALDSALYPEVRSLHENRLQHSAAELLFFEAWKATNKREKWINGGRGTLEILIEPLGPVTQRDMDVATTVIQWLGTNCGHSFLCGVEDEIKRVRDDGNKLAREAMQRVQAKRTDIGTTVGEIIETPPNPEDPQS